MLGVSCSNSYLLHRVPQMRRLFKRIRYRVLGMIPFLSGLLGIVGKVCVERKAEGGKGQKVRQTDSNKRREQIF